MGVIPAVVILIVALFAGVLYLQPGRPPGTMREAAERGVSYLKPHPTPETVAEAAERYCAEHPVVGIRHDDCVQFRTIWHPVEPQRSGR